MYGSGHGEGVSSPYNNDKDKNNRYASSPSYQNSNYGGYSPPAVSGSYAQQQTQVMEDTMRTHYEV